MNTAFLEHKQVTRPLEDVFSTTLADGTGSAKAKAKADDARQNNCSRPQRDWPPDSTKEKQGEKVEAI